MSGCCAPPRCCWKKHGQADPDCRPQIIETRLRRYGLRIRPDVDFEVVNPEGDPRYRDYVDDYFALVGRLGVIPEAARTIVRTNTTVIGALAVKRGEADALIWGSRDATAGICAMYRRSSASVRAYSTSRRSAS